MNFRRTWKRVWLAVCCAVILVVAAVLVPLLLLVSLSEVMMQLAAALREEFRDFWHLVCDDLWQEIKREWQRK